MISRFAFYFIFICIYQILNVQTINPTTENTNTLGKAAEYSILAGVSITNSGTTNAVGNIGISPGSTMTGSITITEGVLHSADADSLAAQNALTTAYTTLAATAGGVDKSGIPLDALTLTAGVYKYTSSCFLNGGVLTLDGGGNPNSRWIFQIGSTITVAVSSQILMTNSGSALNVYWQIGSSATVNASATMVGNIVAFTSISIGTGTTFTGRLLARNGSVTLLSNSVKPVVLNACQWALN